MGNTESAVVDDIVQGSNCEWSLRDHTRCQPTMMAYPLAGHLLTYPDHQSIAKKSNGCGNGL